MLEETTNSDVKIAIIMTELSNIKLALQEIKSSIAANALQFVTKEQFAPIRMFVYGIIALLCTSFLGGLILLVWKT